MATDPNHLADTTSPRCRLGTPLTHHGPGWIIQCSSYEVICWAPGEIVDDGEPTGKNRDEWMLSVETDWFQPSAGRPGSWLSGGFMSGASLTEVLSALAILDAEDRYKVTAVLVHELGDER